VKSKVPITLLDNQSHSWIWLRYKAKALVSSSVTFAGPYSITECIAEHTAMKTITSSKWLALIMSRNASSEHREPSGLERKKTAFDWLEFPLCNKKCTVYRITFKLSRATIALCTIVASPSCFVRLLPVYRASHSWNRQKIRLSNYYNTDYMVDWLTGI